MRNGPFLQDLEKAGFETDSIDTVMCTHLHVDHVGWNTVLKGNRWVPTFSNARYLVNKAEWDYWNEAGDDDFGPVISDSVRPIVDQGLCDLVDANHRLSSEIWLEPTPGHTPGHVSVRISSLGEEALITGDFLHHPCQFARPEWASSADYDKDAARKTRLRVFESYADRPVLIIGTHFAGPTAGYLRRDGDVYRLDV
jgi:glyoxylase-like metal-dependent hydrolase (beta-lactamase superfamily II)